MGQPSSLNPALHSPSPKERIDYWDVVKGIAILGIVVGHVVGGLAYDHLLSRAWQDTFISPLLLSSLAAFYFTAGNFLPRSALKPPAVFLLSKLRGLMLPYVLGILLQVAAESLSGAHRDQPPLHVIARMWVEPYWQFWFLYVLFVLEVMSYLVLRFAPPAILLLLSLLGYIAIALLGSTGWSVLDRALSDFPLLAAGVCLGPSVLRAVKTRRTIPLLAALLLCTIAIAVIIKFQLSIRLRSNLLLSLTGGAMLLSAASLVPIHTLLNTTLAFVGRRSLIIFALHIITAGLAKTALQKAHIDNPALHLILRTGAGIVLPLLLWQLWFSLGFRKENTPAKTGSTSQALSAT